MAYFHSDARAIDAAVARLVAGETAGEHMTEEFWSPPHDSTASTDSSGSSSEQQLPPRRTTRRAPRKRGRPTYYVRKDEIGGLRDEVARLKEELALKATSNVSNGTLCDARAQMASFMGAIEHNNLAFAGTRSLLSSVTKFSASNPAVIPLKMHIHLPVGSFQRDEVLRTMREPKLFAARNFVNERLRHLDPTFAHRQVETFDLPNGDAIMETFDVHPFQSGHSLLQVYDELIFWMKHEEIATTEKTSALTIRESEDIEEASYGQNRFLTTVFDEFKVEGNLAFFLDIVEGSSKSPGHAIYAIDYVDQDDLHPYHSDRFGRKEVVAVIMLVEAATSTGEPVVSMCRWNYSKFCGPSGTLYENVSQSTVRDVLTEVCCEVPKIIAERLRLKKPDNPPRDQDSTAFSTEVVPTSV